ncbi:ATP-binding protein (plasmid) [Brevundimonas staleyi]|uniref:histidine kinase n=1 Tax=Brevundimonas staleyi TaxID=74326 RepID=A0ABW0FNR2_9CAUL
MTRFAPRSITGQVFALAFLCIVTTLATGLLVTLVMPPPPQPVMRVRDVAEAVMSPGRRSDLIVAHHEAAPFPAAPDRSQPVSLIAEGLAHALGVPAERVRVEMVDGTSEPAATSLTILNLPPGAVRAGRQPPTVAEIVATEDITFPPFRAAVGDGAAWVSASPHRPLVSLWHWHLALAFLAAAAVLALPTLLLARIFTRPLRDLAVAAAAFDSGSRDAALPIGGPSEIRQAATALHGMQLRLQNHVEQRTQMLFAIAHDLRTPLTSLKLRLEAAPSALRKVMGPEIRRMQAMIEQLLLYASSGRSPRQERVDLGQLVREAIDRQGGATIVTTGLDLGVIVLGSSLDLSRMLDNLLANAVKFGANSDVYIGLTRQGETAQLTVEDRGPGMPEHQLEKVFQPFVRLEQSRCAETGGIGLGLALVRAVVESHGGKVTLRNRPNGGLTVTVNLPARIRDAETPSQS